MTNLGELSEQLDGALALMFTNCVESCMERNAKVLGFGLMALGIGFGSCGCTKAAGQEIVSSRSRAIDLSVYKEDFAMVSEKRPFDLVKGNTHLIIDEVSKQMDPNSVLFDWQKEGDMPQVTASTYDLGVPNGAGLLKRLNGQQVDLIWPSTDGKPGETLTGKLEAADEGGTFALRTKDKLYVNPTGTIVAPSASTTSSLPRLSVEVESNSEGKKTMEVSYLTRGMSWSADYVAKLEPDATRAELECWATVTNLTGIPFPTSNLTLVAGSPNRSVATRTPMKFGIEQQVAGAKAELADAKKQRMESTPLGELVAYKVPSRTTIGADQMNRVNIFGSRSVAIKRDYSLRLASPYPWQGDEGVVAGRHKAATLSISFVNDESSNLGMPLPSGNVRAYERDASGQQRFTGAATLGDIAKKEHVHLTLTDVFDVYGEQRSVRTDQVDKHLIRKTFELVLHNEKAIPIDLRVVQDKYDNSKLVNESVKSSPLNSAQVQWTIHMEPGAENSDVCR